jgi:hypothetical protein
MGSFFSFEHTAVTAEPASAKVSVKEPRYSHVTVLMNQDKDRELIVVTDVHTKEIHQYVIRHLDAMRMVVRTEPLGRVSLLEALVRFGEQFRVVQVDRFEHRSLLSFKNQRGVLLGYRIDTVQGGQVVHEYLEPVSLEKAREMIGKVSKVLVPAPPVSRKDRLAARAALHRARARKG